MRKIILYLFTILALATGFLFIELKQGQAVQNVIGVRVIKNAGDLANYPNTYVNGILSPLEWYKKNVPNPGNPQAIEIDGYPAIRDGRTIYVAATNQSGDKLYSNIYLISFNEGAEEEVEQIVEQLVRTWQFNVNVGDDLTKDVIRRDLNRVIGMNDFRRELEDFRNQNNQYPSLESGTYQSGWSYSVWPSWRETLNDQLGVEAPVDPVNEFSGCTGVEGVDPETCWNETENRFVCPQGAKVYGYQSLGGGDEYEVYTNFEFLGAGSWQSSETPVDTAGCFILQTAAGDKSDDDLDGITNQLDSCPAGETFATTCSEDQMYTFVTVDQLTAGETCFVLSGRPGLCYQPKNLDPQNRGNALCDVDRDGVGDGCDECPLDPENDRDKDGICAGGVFRSAAVGGSKIGGNDNCPFLPNKDQKNSDLGLELKGGLPQVGDACSSFGTCGNNSLEGFEVCDLDAGTPSNATCRSDCSQWSCNSDHVEINGQCFPDQDNDTVPDSSDNCVDTFNTDQINVDNDEFGDACDWCPDDPNNDEDDDNVCAGPRFDNTKKLKANDNCPRFPNLDQADLDNDGIGDVCDCCVYDNDNDADNDGYCACPEGQEGECRFLSNIAECSVSVKGAIDNCPNIGNPDQSNTDFDLEVSLGEPHRGDACDPATCGNGVVEAGEACDTGGEAYDGSSALETYFCTKDCRTSGGFCGDGIIQTEEQETCEIDPNGNGFIDLNGNVIPFDKIGSSQYPTSQYQCNFCKWEGGRCGDSVKQPGEECEVGAGKEIYAQLIGKDVSLITDAELVALQSACDDCKRISTICLNNPLLGTGCYLDTNNNGVEDEVECQKGKYICRDNALVCEDVFTLTGKAPVVDHCCQKLTAGISLPTSVFNGVNIIFPDKTNTTDLNKMVYPDDFILAGPRRFGYYVDALRCTNGRGGSYCYNTSHYYSCDQVCKNRGQVCVGVGLSRPETDACIYVTHDNGANCGLTGNQTDIDCKKVFGYFSQATPNCSDRNANYPQYNNGRIPFWIGTTACYCQ